MIINVIVQCRYVASAMNEIPMSLPTRELNERKHQLYADVAHAFSLFLIIAHAWPLASQETLVSRESKIITSSSSAFSSSFRTRESSEESGKANLINDPFRHSLSSNYFTPLK